MSGDEKSKRNEKERETYPILPVLRTQTTSRLTMTNLNAKNE